MSLLTQEGAQKAVGCDSELAAIISPRKLHKLHTERMSEELQKEIDKYREEYESDSLRVVDNRKKR